MSFFLARAIDGTRTRGLDLGKVALHQLSHYRIINIVPSQQHYIFIPHKQILVNEKLRQTSYLNP